MSIDSFADMTNLSFLENLVWLCRYKDNSDDIVVLNSTVKLCVVLQLDEVKENEPYKVAMELLQKYDPRQVMAKQQPPQAMGKGMASVLRF